jgi:hypothetical protein
MADLPNVGHLEVEAGVHVLKALRDAGQCAIMLTRLGTLRVAGTAVEFQRAISEKLNREVDTQEAARILLEIRRMGRFAAAVVNDELAVAALESGAMSSIFKDASEEVKVAIRNDVRKKLAASRELLPPALVARQQRLLSATDASLEEMDIEIVNERLDAHRSLSVGQPFLRVRIRYADWSGSGNPLYAFLPAASLTLVMDEANLLCASIVLECDETDIDFLMLRLSEAKRMLSSAVEKSTTK